MLGPDGNQDAGPDLVPQSEKLGDGVARGPWEAMVRLRRVTQAPGVVEHAHEVYISGLAGVLERVVNFVLECMATVD